MKGLLLFLTTVCNPILLAAIIYYGLQQCIEKLSNPLKIYCSIFTTMFLTSCVQYSSVIFHVSTWWTLVMFTLINILLIMLIRPTFNIKSLNQISNQNFKTKLIWILLLSISIFFFFNASKYGSYDAWSLWNTHAKFLYYSDYWQRIFDDHTLMSHSDYPLFLPALIAFFWKGVSNTTFAIPLFFSFSFIVLNSLVVYHGLRKVTNLAYAFIGMLILVADANFQVFNSVQCADTLLAAYILLCTILFTQCNDHRNSILLIGFMAACCTWIKNEGDLFFMIYILIFTIKYIKRPVKIIYFLGGAAFPILITLSYKFFFSPPNDLVAGNQHFFHDTVARLTDRARYALLVKMALDTLINHFWSLIILLLLLLGFNTKALATIPFVQIYLVFVGYLVILITTPHDLEWQIHNSIDRLILHLYPAFVYLGIGSLFKADFLIYQSAIVQKAER